MKNASYYLAFILLALPKLCFSQDSLDGKSTVMQIPSSVIKLSPFHLINFYPSLQIAYEHRIFSFASLQLDLGYVFGYDNGNTNFIDKRGMKGKLEYRQYVQGSTIKKRLNYFSAEPYINAVNFDRQGSITGCFDLECNLLYSQRVNYLIQYREYGISFKYGTSTRFGKNYVFDINAGLGLRFVDYEKKGIPDGGIQEGEFFSLFAIPNERKRIGIGPILGIRVGYILLGSNVPKD